MEFFKLLALILMILFVSLLNANPRPADAGNPADVVILYVIIRNNPESPLEYYNVTCPDLNGNHPRQEEVCEIFEGTDVREAFKPVVVEDEPAKCEEENGGPELAVVYGKVDGSKIKAEFSKNNTCETARWEKLAPLLEPNIE